MPERAQQLLLDLSALTPDRAWHWFLGQPVRIVVTIVAAVVLRWVLLRFIGRTVKATLARADARRSQEPSRAGRVIAQATGAAHERHRQRTLTMGSLLRSIVTFVVALITVLTVMQLVNIPLVNRALRNTPPVEPTDLHHVEGIRTAGGLAVPARLVR